MSLKFKSYAVSFKLLLNHLVLLTVHRSIKAFHTFTFQCDKQQSIHKQFTITVYKDDSETKEHLNVSYLVQSMKTKTSIQCPSPIIQAKMKSHPQFLLGMLFAIQNLNVEQQVIQSRSQTEH